MPQLKQDKFLLHTVLLVCTLLTACGRQTEPPNEPAQAAAMEQTRSFAAKLAAPAPAAAPVAQRRYIALSHSLIVDSSAAALPRIFEETLQRCEKAGCEILSSSLQRQTDYDQPAASLSARMPPAAVDGFLTGFGKDAEVVQHNREADDRTDAVIDVEARIQNLTALRDRLRAMQGRSGKLGDALEVEKQLADTQAELDSQQGQRKALANQTEKVAINIEFRTRPGITERSYFAPVIAAVKNAGHVLMNSLASVITFIAATLPWLLIGVPGFLGLRALWRKWRTRRSARVEKQS